MANGTGGFDAACKTLTQVQARAAKHRLPAGDQIARQGIVNLTGTGRDNYFRKRWCRAQPFDLSPDHRLAAQHSQRFSGQARRGHANLEYCEDHGDAGSF